MKRAGLALLAALAAGCAHAGRPLSVDDASVNDPGNGHLEGWFARQPGKVNSWTLAPAWSPTEGIELGAALSRDTTTPATGTAVQLKWRITASKEDGCNIGAVGGLAHQQGNGNTPYVNGLLTCNTAVGAVHINLGANRAPGGPTLATGGVAFERALGAVTAHIESFGQQRAKPTVQAGLRTEVAKGWQLDGTLGRSAGETLLSVGFKFSF